MLGLKKWMWAAVIAAATTAPVSAQQGTSTRTLGGGTTTSLTGTGGLAGGGAGQLGGGQGQGGLGGGSGQGQLGGNLGGTPLMTLDVAPNLTAPTGTAQSSLSQSNFLAGYYADPRFQGLINAQVNAAPGGFGQPLYNIGAGGTGALRGGTAGRAGTTGLANRGLTGAGRTGLGAGGLGGLNAQNQSGILIPLPVQIAYVAEVGFAASPMAPTQVQADLRGMLDRSSITTPQNVQIVVNPGNAVTLRGTVKDEDEARLVEGLVRVTPGVGEIRNELTFPIARR